MKDELGERIKENYENRTRHFVPRRTFTIIRLDGKAFHTYTKNLDKPFDKDLIEDLDSAVIAILPEIQGAKFAYVQSDEISILLTDFDDINTDAWFDGNIQKIASVSASLITAEFNKSRLIGWMKGERYKKIFSAIDLPIANFDSRIFTIPDRTEVMNYFICRNQDCARNSLSMVAQSLYSHKELQNKNGAELQELIFKKGINWADYPEDLKNGRLIVKEEYQAPVLEWGDLKLANPNAEIVRKKWISKPAWKFTQDKEKLLGMIPKYE